MWERYIDKLPLACPQVGTWPPTQACALTGNWTSDVSVHRPALNSLSHTSQGYLLTFRESGKEEKRQITIQEKNIDWLPPIHAPSRDQSETQECDRKQTGDLSVCGTTSNQLSHTGQNQTYIFKCSVLLLLMNYSWEDASSYPKLGSKQNNIVQK